MQYKELLLNRVQQSYSPVVFCHRTLLLSVRLCAAGDSKLLLQQLMMTSKYLT